MSIRFDIFRVDTVIPHQGVCHGHHLPPVRRIGKDLLVAGHTGIEYNLAAGFPGSGKAAAGKGPSIFKG